MERGFAGIENFFLGVAGAQDIEAVGAVVRFDAVFGQGLFCFPSGAARIQARVGRIGENPHP